jgi:FHS family L-fucose permease-like MFS transporter
VLSALSTLAVVVASGWTCVVALVLVSVFMSLMFPTIYGIALGSLTSGAAADGCPASTDAADGCAVSSGDVKIGASGLIMAILGGALLTPVQGIVSDLAGINQSYLVPFGCFLVVMFYAQSCKKT